MNTVGERYASVQAVRPAAMLAENARYVQLGVWEHSSSVSFSIESSLECTSDVVADLLLYIIIDGETLVREHFPDD